MPACKKEINDHLAELKEKENFELEPNLVDFGMLLMLHIKPILNRLKLFKQLNDERKTEESN